MAVSFLHLAFLQQAAEESISWKLEPGQGLKPAAHPKHLRGAEAPLFHGEAVLLDGKAVVVYGEAGALSREKLAFCTECSRLF
jgi:hypothetical protein